MAQTPEMVITRNLISTILNRTQAGTLRGMTGYISEFARLINTQASDDTDIKQANERLAKAAGVAALQQYDQRRAESDVGQYRVGKGRVSGGRLRRAIASSDFVYSDANGFAIGDIGKLNKEAIHWARINWSAGPQGAHRPTISIKFDNRAIATLHSERAAAPLWSIPAGAYFNGAGEMHISPRGGMSQRVIKKAHKPYHFIEAGFRAAAKRVGPEYETMMFGWLNKAGEDAKNFTKGGVRVKGVYLK